MMNDAKLADELINRLNDLIKDPAVNEAVHSLMSVATFCSGSLEEHPTIQTGRTDDRTRARFLGLLNGIVGVIKPPHESAGWGYIAAYFDDSNKLVRFERTDKPKQATST